MPLDANSYRDRFPHYRSAPVSYRSVRMTDSVFAPRQATMRGATAEWLTAAHDLNGGLVAYRRDPAGYVPADSVLQMEAVKLVEGLAATLGINADPDIAGLVRAWGKRFRAAQGDDGYLLTGFPPGIDRVSPRWLAAHWSHEDYTIGHYIEAAITHRDATGDTELFESAVRAADNMADELLGGDHAYTSGHPEIEQALVRLYGETGERRYLELAGWLLDQRGDHAGRPSYGRMRQDDVAIRDQRTIQGHAVMAAYLFNAATGYVGATGDPAYRDAVLAIWDDLVMRKMYTHGASGSKSSKIEGYRTEPYCILPDDVYGESCSVYANFDWAHSLFRLTGQARYLDDAERMLYNAFCSTISLDGDASIYCNIAVAGGAEGRSPDQALSCCPPNIVKQVSRVGGYVYSTDDDGIIVAHYAANEADIAFGPGIRIAQRTEYPWDGRIVLSVDPAERVAFRLRLRVPRWADAHSVSVNGEPWTGGVVDGWLDIAREWTTGDEVVLDLPMRVRRVTMPPEFREYFNRASLERGPVVYCLEEQDLGVQADGAHAAAGVWGALSSAYLPEDVSYEAEHRPDLLGGVTVLTGEVRLLEFTSDAERPVPATFIPYAVWNNRGNQAMRIWLGAYKAPLVEMLLPEQVLGESCIG